MKINRVVAASAFLVSGVAFACVTLPLPVPPVPVSISWLDMTRAKAAGYFNPAHAAAMSKLDTFASIAVGSSTWEANNYQGYFVYSTPLGGANNVYVDKPCGTKAVDASQMGESGGSEGGGIGGGGGGTSTGIVGFRAVTRYVQVCVDGYCATQSFTDFEPIYGNTRPV